MQAAVCFAHKYRKERCDLRKFQGVYPALITPIAADGSVDVTALEKLIAFHKRQNTAGFYIGGATGEGLLLTKEQRMILAENACKFAGPDVTKIVHIAAINFEESIELAKHAEAVGADAISAIPPIYFQYGEQEVFEYYKAIAESVNIPLIIYYTAAANTNISLDQFKRLFSVKNIEGVKWTNMNYYQMILLRTACPDITIFNGPDEMLICGLSAGADGGIGSTYNFMLPVYQGIYESYNAGDMAKALELQKKADGIIAVLLRYSVIPGVKVILEEMGIPVGVPAKPMQAISREDREKMLRELREAGLEL